MKIEIWKTIEYGNKTYQISNLGRIRNTLSKTRWAENNILCPHKNQGYPRIRLRHNGTYKYFTIHRLVAEYFCENKNPRKFTCVHHKNHIRDDNQATNLEWVSKSKNSKEKDIFIDQLTKRIISNTIQELIDMEIIPLSNLPKIAPLR